MNTTTNYGDWMRQNPELVQQVQQRYGQPAQPASQPAQMTQAAAVQAMPQAQAQPVPQAQPAAVSPVPQAAQFQAPQLAQSSAHTPSSGARAGGATQSSESGTDGVKRIASTIASFWTGGATAAVGAGGNNAKDPTHDTSANDQKAGAGGMDAKQAFGLVSSFMGGGGKGK